MISTSDFNPFLLKTNEENSENKTHNYVVMLLFLKMQIVSLL